MTEAIALMEHSVMFYHIKAATRNTAFLHTLFCKNYMINYIEVHTIGSYNYNGLYFKSGPALVQTLLRYEVRRRCKNFQHGVKTHTLYRDAR